MLAIDCMSIDATRGFVVLAAIVLAGCPGKTPAPQAKSNTKAESKSDSAPTDSQSDQTSDAKAGGGEAKAPGDLGQRFRDPPWFRKTMLDGAEVLDTARSEADDQGRFKSHILFGLPEGTTVEDCAKRVTEKVKADVPNLEQKVQDDGRINVSGSTDRYKVSMICGEGKGVMRAYVGYQWTS